VKKDYWKTLSVAVPYNVYEEVVEVANSLGVTPSTLLRETIPMVLREVGSQMLCPKLFLAGKDVALEVAVGSGIRPLNWLLSAGVYYKNGKFITSIDFKLAKELGGETFMDSGAQQFYMDFNGFDYPYTEKDYLEFALKVGVDHIATLDLPLDILHPRGLPVKDGIRRTVEHGVDLIALAEDLGVLDKIVPVLQGFDDPSQWLESLDLYKSHGVTPDKFKYWGVGSICMMKSPPLVHKILSAVRRALPDVKLHVFGISMNSLRRTYYLIDSYDTSVWIYWAKMDGNVYIWSPRRNAFMRFKSKRRYGTKDLMEANMLEIITMHKDLCTKNLDLIIKRRKGEF
jgi:hypothetical protein